MAKLKQQDSTYIATEKKKGKAAKTKMSSSKTSKKYVKPYRGQGR
jgi:hypothetical protein